MVGEIIVPSQGIISFWVVLSCMWHRCYCFSAFGKESTESISIWFSKTKATGWKRCLPFRLSNIQLRETPTMEVGRDTDTVVQSKQKGVEYHQYPKLGSAVYWEYLKYENIFFCGSAVINGEITFGTMISMQFIIGMLNGSLVQFIRFAISAQYAKICFCGWTKSGSYRMRRNCFPSAQLPFYLKTEILHWPMPLFNFNIVATRH